MRRSFLLVITPAALLTALFLPSTAQAKTVTIQASEFKFSQPSGPVAVGDTIVFRNTGAAPHNAVASDGSFKTDTIQPGSQQTVQVNKAGSIAFVCTFHESVGMKSTLTVAAAAGANAGAPPPGTNPSGSDPGSVEVPPTPAASPTPGQSEAKAATEPSPSPSAGKKGDDTKKVAAEAPPTQKYFPVIALLMLLALAPMVGMSYRRLVKAGPGGPAPSSEPPAEE